MTESERAAVAVLAAKAELDDAADAMSEAFIRGSVGAEACEAVEVYLLRRGELEQRLASYSAQRVRAA